MYVLTWSGAEWEQRQRLVPSTGMAQFGNDVAISRDGTTIVVGAHHDASAATGIDGVVTMGGPPEAGAVYIYQHVPDHWQLMHYVKLATPHACDHFGERVAISSDAKTIAVGAPDSGNTATTCSPAPPEGTGTGAAYLLVNNGSWSQTAMLTATAAQPTAWFGFSVALDDAGTTLVTSAPLERTDAGNKAGAVYVAGTANTGLLRIEAPNKDAGDHFGAWVDVSASGDVIAAGATFEASNAIGIGGNENDNSQIQTGAAYVFAPPPTTQPTIYVKPSIPEYGLNFGKFVSLSADGNTLVVSHWYANNILDSTSPSFIANCGAVEVYRGPNWAPVARLLADDPTDKAQFGWDAKISGDGSTIAAPAPAVDNGAGAVYIIDTP